MRIRKDFICDPLMFFRQKEVAQEASSSEEQIDQIEAEHVSVQKILNERATEVH